MTISKLRKLLVTHEQPQYIVAAACKMHPFQLSKYSLGREVIRPHHLIALCKYFHLEPEDLVGYLDEPDIINWLDEQQETNVQ